MKRSERDPSATPTTDESSAILRGLLERTRDDGLDPRQVEAIWAGLGPVAGGASPHVGPQGAAGAASSATTAATVGLAVKALALMVITGGLATGAFAVSRRELAPAHAFTAPIAAQAFAAPSATTPLDPPVAAPAAWVPAPSIPMATAANADLAPTGPVVAAGPRSVVAPAHREALRVETTTAPGSRDQPATASVAAILAAPSPVATADRTSAVNAPVAANAPFGASPDPTPSEAGLLLKARHDLPTDPAATLAITQQHARLFPGSDFAEEREVLAIEALAHLGRSSEARGRLDLFSQRFPRSIHIGRLGALLDRPRSP
jgi:hypothetical protein